MNRNAIAYMSEGDIVKAQQEYLSKIYAWMVGGLLITGLTSWYVFSSGLWVGIVSNSILFYGLIFGELAMVFTLAGKIDSMSKTTAAALFLGYSLLNGITLSVILAAYTLESISKVFFITAAMFGIMSIIGFTTKKDLSGVGRFLYMGLIGLIIAIVVEMIFGGFQALSFAISVIGVIIFAGLTAWDTQKLKKSFQLQYESDDIAMKASIKGALMLYLDFINMFLFLLRLFGGSRS